ncbi:cytochrome C oxidase subunit IV family protein [Alsobacter sp. KACC 23698]|uniref:Cytochrome C oxidase subunit IV family protein n=1 Tax=Alsobacter sp. KACC 23698 TaxID=3149229 RepID=A0AAU7JJ79_9HYPH
MNSVWIELLLLLGVSALVLAAGLPRVLTNGIIVAVLLAKARLVSLEFLGLRSSPVSWRRALAAGFIIVGSFAFITTV